MRFRLINTLLNDGCSVASGTEALFEPEMAFGGWRRVPMARPDAQMICIVENFDKVFSAGSSYSLTLISKRSERAFFAA